MNNSAGARCSTCLCIEDFIEDGVVKGKFSGRVSVVLAIAASIACLHQVVFASTCGDGLDREYVELELLSRSVDGEAKEPPESAARYSLHAGDLRGDTGVTLVVDGQELRFVEP